MNNTEIVIFSVEQSRLLRSLVRVGCFGVAAIILLIAISITISLGEKKLYYLNADSGDIRVKTNYWGIPFDSIDKKSAISNYINKSGGGNWIFMGSVGCNIFQRHGSLAPPMAFKTIDIIESKEDRARCAEDILMAFRRSSGTIDYMEICKIISRYFDRNNTSTQQVDSAEAATND